MTDYILERIYKREGDILAAFTIHTLEYWNKHNQEIDYNCYVKEGNILYKPIRFKSRTIII
jgi:hypothetical protein